MIELLEVVLRGTPKLVGAACSNYPPELFDGGTRENRVAALKICQHECPCQPKCLAWAQAEPGALDGVVGGQFWGTMA